VSRFSIRCGCERRDDAHCEPPLLGGAMLGPRRDFAHGGALLEIAKQLQDSAPGGCDVHGFLWKSAFCAVERDPALGRDLLGAGLGVDAVAGEGGDPGARCIRIALTEESADLFAALLENFADELAAVLGKSIRAGLAAQMQERRADVRARVEAGR